MKHGALTRRNLLELGGLALAGGLIRRPHAAAAIVETPDILPGIPSRGFLYVASTTSEKSGQGIQVFAVDGATRKPVEFVPSAAPAGLAASADGTRLFVANSINRYTHLPAGSVESFAIDKRSGRLSLLSRQRLALSAVHPSQLAVSTDGLTLAVVAAGDTSYTLLAVSPQGELSEPHAVRKILFTGGESAGRISDSTQICFTPDGHLLAADYRSHALSVFTCASGRIERLQQQPLASACRSAVFRVNDDIAEVWVSDSAKRQLAAFNYDRKFALRRGEPTRLLAEAFEGHAEAPSKAAVPHAALWPEGAVNWTHLGSSHGSGSLRATINSGTQAFAWTCA